MLLHGSSVTAARPASRSLRRVRTSALPVSEGDRELVSAFNATFPGLSSRCLDSYLRLSAGQEVTRVHADGRQEAHSFVEGLATTAWHEPAAFPWLRVLEAHAAEIQAELAAALEPAAAATLERRGESVWAPAARDDATAYGPEWRTLVLQDRGEWSATNSALFPVTTRLVRDVARAPSVEVFFARQAAGSGIAPHTDGNNFILCAHLGLRVPAGGAAACWVKCGDAPPRAWEAGKGIVFDTSYIHETWNSSAEDRIVLIIRFWHSSMTPTEVVATQWLFEASDDTSREGLQAASRAAQLRLRELAKPAKSKGFGKK